jgi:hypothetical protein
LRGALECDRFVKPEKTKLNAAHWLRLLFLMQKDIASAQLSSLLGKDSGRREEVR